jgi:hypothetical protein
MVKFVFLLKLGNCNGGVIVSMLASSAVDCGFEPDLASSAVDCGFEPNRVKPKTI